MSWNQAAFIALCISGTIMAQSDKRSRWFGIFLVLVSLLIWLLSE